MGDENVTDSRRAREIYNSAPLWTTRTLENKTAINCASAGQTILSPCIISWKPAARASILYPCSARNEYPFVGWVREAKKKKKKRQIVAVITNYRTVNSIYVIARTWNDFVLAPDHKSNPSAIICLIHRGPMNRDGYYRVAIEARRSSHNNA